MTPTTQPRDAQPSTQRRAARPPTPPRDATQSARTRDAQPTTQPRGAPPPTRTRGVQLSLAARQAPTARIPALPHPPCPICAGPTARHAGRPICVICGHGAREVPYHPRRHPN